jgi:hypothetical protein
MGVPRKEERGREEGRCSVGIGVPKRIGGRIGRMVEDDAG